MGAFSKLTSFSCCVLSFFAFHVGFFPPGGVLVLAAPAADNTPASRGALSVADEDEEITDNFLGAPLPRLPSIEETRAAVLAYSTGALNCSEGSRCLQTPVAAVRDYLRTLTGESHSQPVFFFFFFFFLNANLKEAVSLAELRVSETRQREKRSRILIVAKTQLDFSSEDLRNKLSKLGCLNVAIVDLEGLQATVGLFKQGVVSRVRVDQEVMSQVAGQCKDKLLPLTFHQHEAAKSLAGRGQLNTDGACNAANTGGHHDPGYACGPLGNSDCKNQNIPPSSSVTRSINAVPSTFIILTHLSNCQQQQPQQQRQHHELPRLSAQPVACALLLLVLVCFRALKGTPADNGEYQCTPEIYEKRPFACHAGDLSGKVGTGVNVSPDGNRPDFRLLALDTHADNTCVASDNKQSLVLHCESTNYRLACAPFERVETAGGRIPELLQELIRAARSALPHSKSQSALLASLVLVNELEQRVAVLETAAKATRPGDGEEEEEEIRRSE
ncbi:hypothetical protein Efla_007152 [Eimeria flavescens]